MTPLDAKTLDWMWFDPDARDVRLREIISQRLAEPPPPVLDDQQGNIGLNLPDAEQRRLTSHVLFLAGSAINSIKNAAGKYDPPLGAEAMRQALDVHRSGELREIPAERHARELARLAEGRGLDALREALRQRHRTVQCGDVPAPTNRAGGWRVGGGVVGTRENGSAIGAQKVTRGSMCPDEHDLNE